MNNRRKLLAALGASALTATFGSFAQQQSKVWRVGFLSQRHVDFLDSDYYYGPFRRGMRELGYVEGKNLVIEWRSAEGTSERLPALAAAIVQSNVDLVVTAGTPASLAAQKATTTIPIVIIGVADPVGSGLVKSLGQPGGNITGISNLTGELFPKLLELLLKTVPRIHRVAVLVNPTNFSHVAILKDVQSAARKFGVNIVPVEARTPQEIDNAFASMRRQNARALVVTLDPFFQQQKSQIIELVAKDRLPSIAAYGEYVDAGGLLSYGSNLHGNSMSAATYVDKIFKGAKPADLPVEQPTKFELFINGKTARALGLKIPQSLLISADKVIE